MKIGDKIRFVRNTKNVVGITLGKVYEVTRFDSDYDPYVIGDNGRECNYTGSQFDVLTLEDAFLEDVKRAKNLVGKRLKIISTGEYFTPDSFGVATPYTNNIDSDDLVDGNAVYLESDDAIIPLKDVEEVTNVIKLTDDYDAIIEGDIVKVGCQNIPIDKVREILNLWENLD